MLCFADSLHIFQGLFVFNVLYYLAVPFDDVLVLSMFYMSINTSMAGLAVIEVQFPEASDITVNNPYVLGGILLASLVLVLIAVCSGVISSVVTGLALLLLGGVSVATFEQYGISFSGLSFGEDLDSSTRMYLGLIMLSGLFAIFALLYYIAKIGRFILCTIVYAMLALFALKCAWTQGVLPSRICCDTLDPSSCPFYISMQDAVVLGVLLWLRIVSFASFRWHARYKAKYGTLHQALKSTLHAKRESTPLLGQPQPAHHTN